MLPMSEDRRRPERLLRRHQQRPRARARPYPRLRPRPTSRRASPLSLPTTAGDTDASASADLSAIMCASIESSGDSDLLINYQLLACSVCIASRMPVEHKAIISFFKYWLNVNKRKQLGINIDTFPLQYVRLVITFVMNIFLYFGQTLRNALLG